MKGMNRAQRDGIQGANDRTCFEGGPEGDPVGASEGLAVGPAKGAPEGAGVGTLEGASEGPAVGCAMN